MRKRFRKVERACAQDEDGGPHASRRIAALRGRGRVRAPICAAMLLSMRARAEEPTCGCRKRSPGPFPCFRPVLYRECRNSNVSSRERTVRRARWGGVER